jgi:hypothetical protein
MKCLVVRRERVLGTGRLAAMASLHMLVVVMLATFIFGFRVTPLAWVVFSGWLVHLFALVGIPCYLLHARLPGWHLGLYVAVCTVTFQFWELGCTYLLDLLGPQMASIMQGRGKIVFLDPCTTTVVLIGSAVSSKLLARWRSGKVVIQDGLTCPRCGYSLLGTPGHLCSECGYDFGFAELGITESEFRLKQAFRRWVQNGKPLVMPDERGD